MSYSSTDSAIFDQECIMVRFLNPDTKILITTIASIDALETPDADEVFSSIKKGLKMIDIDLDSDGGPALICVNMDGASVNMGAKNGVAKKISDSVQHPVLITHCVAHRLELGILDAAKQVPYLEEFDGIIKRIYKFYSFSPKRRAHLNNVSDVLDKDLIMYSDIKSIRWVFSKRRAVLAVETDYEATVTHLEQILETSQKTDEKAQAKKILSDITKVKFIKYLHLMIDVLRNVSAASLMFQIKDLLMVEVQEVVDTLYTQLHAMKVSPGQSLKKFYESFDETTRLYNNIKLNGPLPMPFEQDNDIQKFLSDVAANVLDRFKNLSEPSLVHFRAFDFRLWPRSLDEIAVCGNEAVEQLCETYSDLLTDDEKQHMSDEWQQLKVRLSMQQSGHPLAVYSQILEAGEKQFVNISKLIELFFVFSPSTAECERGFSSMNLIKTPTRSKLSQANLLNQMRIVICGQSLKDFDPTKVCSTGLIVAKAVVPGI